MKWPPPLDLRHIYGDVPDDTVRFSTPTAERIREEIACLTDPYARYKYYIEQAAKFREVPEEGDR